MNRPYKNNKKLNSITITQLTTLQLIIKIIDRGKQMKKIQNLLAKKTHLTQDCKEVYSKELEQERNIKIDKKKSVIRNQ